MKLIRGFTLIELLITISISAVITFMGILVARDSLKNQNLKKADKEMRIGINQAKEDAFFGKKPMDPTNPSNPEYCNGFEGNLFTIDTVNKKYTITAQCTSGSGDNKVVASHTFSNDVIITTAGGTSIMFDSIDRTTSLSNNLNITLTVDANRTSTITIAPSGEIQ